jgi:hypothetical protein
MIVFDHMASLENHKKPCVLIIDLGGGFRYLKLFQGVSFWFVITIRIDQVRGLGIENRGG